MSGGAGGGGKATAAGAQANGGQAQANLPSWFPRLQLPFWRANSGLTSVGTPTPAMTPPPDAGEGAFSPGSLRGRTITLSSTPPASRRSSPAPGLGAAGRKGSKRGRGGKGVSRQGTPLLEVVDAMGKSGPSAGGTERDPSSVAAAAEPATEPTSGPGGGGSGQPGEEGALVEVPSLDDALSSSRRAGDPASTRKRSPRGGRASTGGSIE